MRTETHNGILSMRSRSADSLVLPFVLSHTGLMIVLGFGGAGLADSGVQLSIATFAVLGSLWTVMAMDDCIVDFAAGSKDLDDEVASSNLGRNYVKKPFKMMRVVNVAVVALIVIAELMAIY
jgi:hypothetical protein